MSDFINGYKVKIYLWCIFFLNVQILDSMSSILTVHRIGKMYCDTVCCHLKMYMCELHLDACMPTWTHPSEQHEEMS